MWCDEDFITEVLKEDLGAGDVTCEAIIPISQISSARLICKEKGILAGAHLFQKVFEILNPSISVSFLFQNGEEVSPGQEVAKIKGSTRGILAGERTALNLLQHLSGIATQTRQIQEILKDSPVKILDTRKTLPLLRRFQKEAVKAGGGTNHRMGLYDRFLIKENHIAAAGSITQAVADCKKYRPELLIEVETTCLAEVEEALNTEADIIMLDNFTNPQIQEAAQLIRRQSSKKIEVSGNMTPQRIAQIKSYPIDYISMGALTHSVKALDFSLLIETTV